MIDRRAFIGGISATSLALPTLARAALPVPQGNRISFDVLRNGTKVGIHTLTFTQNGNDLSVAINVDLLIKVLAVPVYTYTIDATELWSGGVFQSLMSKVNNGGTHLEVQAHKVAAGYDVVGINHNDPSKSYPEYTAPPDTMPLTYWNKAMLKANILNIQTAHSYPAVVKPSNWNKLPTAEGGSIVAQRYDVTGKLDLTVWYDQMQAWSGLNFNYQGDFVYEKIIT